MSWWSLCMSFNSFKPLPAVSLLCEVCVSSPFIYYYYECIPTARSLSELSSLHDGGNADFKHTYQTVQMKALPPIADLDDRSVLRAAPPTHNRRHRRDRGNHSDDELDRRWSGELVSDKFFFHFNAEIITDDVFILYVLYNGLHPELFRWLLYLISYASSDKRELSVWHSQDDCDKINMYVSCLKCMLLPAVQVEPPLRTPAEEDAG